MKKKLLVTSLVLLGGLGVCSTAPAVITGSKHDFSTAAWSTGQICLPCHAPHNNKNAGGALLWNHDASVAPYTLYTSPTYNGSNTGAPAATSKFCLSCHDGSVAIDAFGTHGTTSARGLITGTAKLGTDLSNDHPISFPYDLALVNADKATGGGIAGLVTPASASEVVAGIPLFNGKLECASCHDVHNKHTIAKLLNSTNVGSALCLKCHIK